MSHSNNLPPLDSLSAYIDHLKGDPEAALKKLDGYTDPDSIRRKLAIFIDTAKFQEGADSIRDIELDSSWVDSAIFLHAVNGDVINAEKSLAWAISQKDLRVAQKSCLKFISGIMHSLSMSRSKGSLLSPSAMSAIEIKGLEVIAKNVGPTCNAIVARGLVEVELESLLLQGYLDVMYLLAKNEDTTLIWSTLATRSPIPARVGTAILQKIGKPDIRIVSRLWDENPKSFEARFISCVILGRELNDKKTAWERTESLTELASNANERENLCEFLYELWNGDTDWLEFSKIEEFTNNQLGPDSYLLKLLLADRSLDRGDYENSLTILESVRNENDPRWLRAYSNAKVKAGDKAQAFDVLNKLSSMVADPNLLLATAHLASEQGLVEDEAHALSNALLLDPNNLPARRRLATIYSDLGDYKKAADQLKIISEQAPEDEDVIQNLAVSYAYSNEIEKALRVLTPRTENPILPLKLLRIRALIMQGAGEGLRAFAELREAKQVYWDDPEFLLLFMNLAYASAEETDANEALMKLQELRETGVVDEKLMKMVSMDEMREWIQDSAKKHDFIRQQLLEGKFPWIVAARMQRDAPYWSWLLKTQQMDWIWDDPLNRASYTVYSTYGFSKVIRSGASTLDEISCSIKGSPVVVDITALITLHNLGLIGNAAEYFGQLYIPAFYLSQVLEDTRNLLPHQQSQRDATDAIILKVTEQKISVLASETDSNGGTPVVDEYVGDSNPSAHLSLADLVNTLCDHGFLGEDEAKEVRVVAHRPSSINAKIEIGQKIVIAGSTLVTIYGRKLLDLVVKEFHVFIPKTDYDELIAKSRAFSGLRDAHAKHTELWTLLRNDQRVVFAPTPEKFELSNKKEEALQLGLAAMHLAKSRNLPLLADDRVLQMLVLNEKWESSSLAFGTDALVIALSESGSISLAKAAQSILRLMEWRYRFILMPANFLKSLADQYRNNPPGLAMKRVAKYVHDCMSDLGLPSGLEGTSVPTSIAVRLYQSWAQCVGDLIMDIWIDKTTSDTYAEEFTSWAISEMLPSPPRVLNEHLQSRIASLTVTTVLTRALIRGSGSTDYERVNLGLRSITSAFGASEREYFEIVSKVIKQTND